MELLTLNISGRSPDPPTEAEIRFQAALISAIVATLAAFVVRFAFGGPLVPELLADFVFAVIPISLVEFGVSLLGPFAKHLAFVGCTGLYIAGLAGLAVAFLHRSGLGHPSRAALFSLLVWSVNVVIVMPLLGGGLFGSNLPRGALFTSTWLLVVSAVSGAALGLTLKLYAKQEENASWLERRTPGRVGSAGSGVWVTRRRVIRWIGYSVVVVAAYDMGRSLLSTWRQGRSGRVSGGDNVFPNIDGLAREVTPTDDFYLVSKNPFDPEVDPRGWKLEVAGLVENPFSIGYDEIKSLPAIEQYATLECISNEIGGNLIGNALWRGVRLKELLDRARLKPGVVDVVLRATDGYADSIPLARAQAEGTILAYAMNGSPLNSKHGFPLRLIVPGIFGMKNVKWITRIEAVDYDFKGYWQARGWDDRAEYKSMSRIDAPAGAVRGQATIAGIAFAGDRGISKVEISTDGGKSWEVAEIKPALSPFSWILWHKEWAGAPAGEHRLVVRATDGSGITQTAQITPPIPDGASGYHARVVAVD